MMLAYQIYYLEVLKRLREKVDTNDMNFFLTTREFCITTMNLLAQHCLWGSFFASKQITVIEHPLPPYSSDLAHNDFFLFPKI
jgi:hypothetical protein